jgi:ATP-dependent helicase HrpB
LYGVHSHPRVLGVPVLIRMLSPARRPIHVTRDLEGFWGGTWAEVRKDMKGRYPKHDWPERP